MTKEKTVPELLDDLQKVVDLLKANLPKQAPLIIPKSTEGNSELVSISKIR